MTWVVIFWARIIKYSSLTFVHVKNWLYLTNCENFSLRNHYCTLFEFCHASEIFSMNFQKFIFDNEFWAFLYRQGCLKILLCKTQSRNLKFRKFCNFHCNLYLKFEYETFGSKHIIWFRIRTFSTDVFWNESFVVAHYVAVEVANSEICSQPFFEVDSALLKIKES